jgi:hypothetical protein
MIVLCDMRYEMHLHCYIYILLKRKHISTYIHNKDTYIHTYIHKDNNKGRSLCSLCVSMSNVSYLKFIIHPRPELVVLIVKSTFTFTWCLAFKFRKCDSLFFTHCMYNLHTYVHTYIYCEAVNTV